MKIFKQFDHHNRLKHIDIFNDLMIYKDSRYRKNNGFSNTILGLNLIIFGTNGNRHMIIYENYIKISSIDMIEI
jgi:hypothetical protein